MKKLVVFATLLIVTTGASLALALMCQKVYAA